jgi:DNA-binding response OmpR family regulator
MRREQQTGVILVVEDNDAIRTAVKVYLEAAGYIVICATDGAVGLDCFQQNRAAITMLLTDVMMPNMNGMDLADRVLELDGNLPVLFMSGTANNADRGYGCIAKPFRRAELLARVGVAMQRQPA